MKTVLLCTALLALTSAQAFAVNIGGTWNGSGKITDNKGYVGTCEAVVLTIVHTATVLNVSSDFTCAGQRGGAPGGNLEIRGGDLYEGGVKIGKITDTSTVLNKKDAQHSMDTNSTFTDKEMKFKTITTNAADPGRVVTFEGVVRR